MPRCVEPTHLAAIHPIKDSVEDLDAFPYLAHFKDFANSESQPSPPPLAQMGLFPGRGALLSDYIEELWDDAQGWLETNLQNNFYNPFATCEEYQYIQCGIQQGDGQEHVL
jgi:hypothetical protein